jgi:hypothetical protein
MRIPLLPAILVSCCLLAPNIAVRAADTNPPPRMTVELRDGSRVVGTSLDSQIRFSSGLLGTVKLEVKDISSVECASTNSAKLTTTAGDTLNVSWVDSALEVKTGFGKVELPVSSVRKLTVSSSSTTRTHPAGLVALWSAEGNARDSAGSNNGIIEGSMNFVPGQIGQAFSFADSNAWVKIPASPSLDVGAGSGFTLSAWINPLDFSAMHPIFEWNPGDGSYWGVHFYVNGSDSQIGSGSLYANIMDGTGPWHQFYTPAGSVFTGTFQHVALTYDKMSGYARIYCNGVLAAQQFIGHITPRTVDNLYLGHRPPTVTEVYTFSGAMDEVAVYNRALSPAEIQDLCRSENGGELPPAPAVPALRAFNQPFSNGFGE